MKKMILGCFLYGTAIGLYAQAPQGDFKGSIQIGQTTMPIVFHFGEQNGQPVTTTDSPAQGVFGFPVQSSECLSDGELTLKIPQIQFCYVGKVRGDSLIEGTVTQAGQSLPLNLVRTARKAGASSEPERPGTPKPPFPYREEEVTVTTKDGIKLSGSLTLPEGEGPFPAVLLISGSGPQDRNEEAWKYKPFLMIADCLTRQGIAVLRMDDRGTGKSGGRYADATLQLAATDAECALDYLLRRKDIRREKTGLAGHSMGGTIAFRIAAQCPQDVAFVLSLAGAAIPGKDLMMHQCEKTILSQLPAAASDSLRPLYEELYGTMALPLPLDSIRHRSAPLMVSIWQHLGINEGTYRENLTDSIRRRNARLLTEQAISPEIASIVQYDPSHDLSRVQCPVWAANGAKDLQVLPEENMEAIETLAKGSPQVVTHIYHGLNHLFMEAPTGHPSEYGLLKGNFSQEVLQDMAEWIKKTVGAPQTAF